VRRGEWVTLQNLWTVTVFKRRIFELFMMAFPCDMHKCKSLHSASFLSHSATEV